MVYSSEVARGWRSPRWGWGLLVFPASVLAVHELRYVLAYGSRAGSELSAHGDHYVTTAAVVTGALVGLAMAVGVVRLLATSRGQGSLAVPRVPVWLLWLGLTLLLLVGFWVSCLGIT